jgi:hypothetical protein
MAPQNKRPELYLSARLDHLHSTRLKIRKDIISERRPRRDYPPNTLADVERAKERKLLYAIPYECIDVMVHDGFRSHENPITGKIKWIEVGSHQVRLTEKRLIQRTIHSGTLKFLSRHNKAELRKTLRWYREVVRDSQRPGVIPGVRNQISLVVQEYEHWLAGFAKWFWENEGQIPNEILTLNEEQSHVRMPEGSGNVVASQRQPSSKLRLSPGSREKLNDKIVELIDGLIDTGQATQRDAFKRLAMTSEKKLGHKLSPKAIEGRYTRHPKVKK